MWTLIKNVALSWHDDLGPSVGAALAFYTIFSLAPLLLIVVSVAGLVFGQDAARGAIEAQLQGLMGAQGASAVQTLLASVNQPAEGRIATVMGVCLLFIGATTLFIELQGALDRIWRIPERSTTSPWLVLVRARALSFGLIMVIGLLLILSLVASAWLAALGRWWQPGMGGWYPLAATADAIFSFGFLITMFAMIYKLLPRVRVQWKDVWIGAVVTALLFTIGKALIGLYIGRSGVASGLGAAGSLVVLLLWLYYSAQIFLIGAQFTWIYANTFGSRSHGRGLPVALTQGASSPACGGVMR